MANFTQMGLRISEEQRADLETIASAMGVEVAQLIRFAIDGLRKHYRRSGNRLVLPIDFSEMIQIMPGPSSDYGSLRVAEDPPK